MNSKIFGLSGESGVSAAERPPLSALGHLEEGVMEVLWTRG
jgi:hypothetical protein